MPNVSHKLWWYLLKHVCFSNQTQGFLIPVHFQWRKQTLVNTLDMSVLRMRGLHDKRHLLAKCISQLRSLLQWFRWYCLVVLCTETLSHKLQGFFPLSVIFHFQAGTNCQECEEGCSKERPEGCRHPCRLPCHAGPCPPCKKSVKMRCHCKAMALYVVCRSVHWLTWASFSIFNL